LESLCLSTFSEVSWLHALLSRDPYRAEYNKSFEEKTQPPDITVLNPK